MNGGGGEASASGACSSELSDGHKGVTELARRVASGPSLG